MRLTLFILLLFVGGYSFSQENFRIGHFESLTGTKTITLNSDNTFEYHDSHDHPYFLLVDSFSEKGIWKKSKDTIILNPHLKEKIYTEYSFNSYSISGDTNIFLTLNHINRHIDANDSIQRVDTIRIRQADYYFNDRASNEQVRIVAHKNNCFWGGTPSKQVIVDSNTFRTVLPVGELQKITIGCYEFRGMKSFSIHNPTANRLVLNVFSNYYIDGQLRHKEILIRGNKTILTVQNKSGEFYTDVWVDHKSKMKRCESGHKWNTLEKLAW